MYTCMYFIVGTITIAECACVPWYIDTCTGVYMLYVPSRRYASTFLHSTPKLHTTLILKKNLQYTSFNTHYTPALLVSKDTLIIIHHHSSSASLLAIKNALLISLGSALSNSVGKNVCASAANFFKSTTRLNNAVVSSHKTAILGGSTCG